MADESKKTDEKVFPGAQGIAAPPPAPPPMAPPFTPEQEKLMADLTARKAASPLSPVEEKQLADMQARKKALEAPAKPAEVAIPHGPIRVAKETELAAKKKMMADLPEQIAALEAELKPQPPVACIPLAMGATCPACGYVRHEGNLEPHPVA